jgi:hypothetical protein
VQIRAETIAVGRKIWHIPAPFFYTFSCWLYRHLLSRAFIFAYSPSVACFRFHYILWQVGGTKEDHDKIAANMRRASHAELAAAKEEWDRRKDEDTGESRDSSS